jgi:hypothetical protein
MVETVALQQVGEVVVGAMTAMEAPLLDLEAAVVVGCFLLAVQEMQRAVVAVVDPMLQVDPMPLQLLGVREPQEVQG